MPSDEFYRAIEEATGMSIEHIQETPLCELRTKITGGRKGMPGEVSGGRDYIVSRHEVDKM